jgi:uncharacterized membrane protein YphA (DoxX/SURF4 family)
VSLLRLWMIGTSLVVVGLMVWAFAPVLVFVVLVTAGLGIVSAAMIAIARTLQAWRERQ